MSTLGRITNSLAAATVENSLSLFQFNFDFTFQKTAPPVEFNPIGQALSVNRRFNAENGAAHRTARKLGWLFEQIVPDTPRLLKVYGLRVCEILAIPGVNPVGSAADGPFREYVGADCTSLWAAATSGISALGIHLLACMLARAWDAQTATAIWVELVKARQADILEKLGKNSMVSETSVTAARQDFLRSELSDWDASARSWLAQADKALAFQRDQYLLIVKNISLSTGYNKDPYINVIAAWTLAMSTMERHLEGISQQVSDGAALYAISAWHLYPNLVYFGDCAKTILFSDNLFEEQATMTLGLNEIATTKENRGTHWSLCLSHLKFYGDPVPVESVEDRTRATISQFRIIVLGSILESWRVPLEERLDAVKWIHDLWGYLKRTAPFGSATMSLSSHTSWLAVLGQAAETIVTAQGAMLEKCEDYLSHGELWAGNFLMYQDSLDPLLEETVLGIRPYFGLCNPMIMQALQEPLDIDAGITYLRLVARSMGLTEDGGIICYTEIRDGKAYYEYCSAVPHMDSTMKLRHCRWIKIRSPAELRGRRLGCKHTCHQGSTLNRSMNDVDVNLRIDMITTRGEQCFSLGEGSLHNRTVFLNSTVNHNFNSNVKASYLFWDKPPPLFGSPKNTTAGNHCFRDNVENNISSNLCTCLAPSTDSYSSHTIDVLFEKFIGTVHGTGEEQESSFELYVRTSVGGPAPSERYDIADVTNLNVKPSAGSRWLKSPLPQPVRVWDFIERFGNPRSMPKLVVKESISTPAGLDWTFSHSRAADLISNHVMPQPSTDWLSSLELVGVINEIYEHLPGATISLRALEYPILDAHWATELIANNMTTMRAPEGTGEIFYRMGRKEIFSCIAMMQTGSANIEPRDFEEVMAISSDNSIFVAGALLSDPYNTVNPREIRHIVGNVGYSGLNLMVAPAGILKIRRPKNEVRIRGHRSNYDFERQDHFEGSSLHLTFTGQRFPLISTDIDTIDQDIFFLQSVVSLWDGGNHVADLDILKVQKTELSRVRLACSCVAPSSRSQGMDLRCLDSWDDILRPPRRLAVMRAHGNWSARLAAAAIFIQQGKSHTVAIFPTEPMCWTCLKQFYSDPEDHWPEILVD